MNPFIVNFFSGRAEIQHYCCFLVLLFSTVSISAFAQQEQGLIMYRSFGGADFEYTRDTVTYRVSQKQVLQLLLENPVAYAEFKKARKYEATAGVLGFTGGALILFPIGTSLAGGEPEWGLAAGGAALMLATIPFHRAFKRHAQSAIEIYNKKFASRKLHLEYYCSGLGAKVIVKF